MTDEYFAAEQFTDQSQSSIHHALRASRRRLVVGLVAHRLISTINGGTNDDQSEIDGISGDPVLTVRQLAKEIVSIEEGISIEHATGDEYHSVYTSLIQTHLSELDDVDAIEYDSDRKKVTPSTNLFALALVAAISSPMAQMLFHDAISDKYDEDVDRLEGSTTD